MSVSAGARGTITNSPLCDPHTVDAYGGGVYQLKLFAMDGSSFRPCPLLDLKGVYESSCPRVGQTTACALEAPVPFGARADSDKLGCSELPVHHLLLRRGRHAYVFRILAGFISRVSF